MNKITTSRLLFLFTLLFTFLNANAQAGYAWEKYGNGINGGNGCSGSILLSKYIDSNLYVCELHPSNKIVTIHKWDGITWTSYPQIDGGNNGIYLNDLEVYRNEIYVSGSINALKNLARPGNKALGIIKFDGTKWDSLPSYPSFYLSDSMQSANKMCTYKHKLYYSVQSVRDKLFSLDSFGNTNLIATNSKIYSFAFINLKILNNKLMVSGYIDSLLDLSKTSGLFFYDGSNLSYTTSKASKNIWLTGIRNDSQYVVVDANNNIELWEENNLIRNITPPFSFFYYHCTGLTFYKDFIIASFYDTALSAYDMNTTLWDGTRFQGVKAIEAGPNKAIITSCSDFKGAAELKQGGIVNGRLYYDKDSNCNYNNGDLSLPYQFLELSNGSNSFYAYTDKNGNYSVSVLPGTYTLKTQVNDILYTVQPCSTASVSVTAGNTYYNINLPIHPLRYRNLSTSITGSRGFTTRRGFTEKYRVTGANYSSTDDSLILKIKFDSKATFVSSTTQPFSNSNNELVYKFYNLSFNQKVNIDIYFSTSNNTSNLGDTIKFNTMVVNSIGDSLIENNYDTLFQRVVGSYDPNIKESYPEGKVKPGLKKIKYVVHFQNTGTDTAYKVSVVDTFTQKLGLRSLRVTGTSHPASYSLRVMNNNVLVWEFDNILLPDSHINEKASHGYIAFEANINSVLAVGDSINNKAYIYFDYNKPIITNLASVVVSDSLTGVNTFTVDPLNPIKVYPNPAQSNLHIELKKEYLGKTLSLYNQMGQLIKSFTMEDESHTLDVSQFSKGIYILKLEGSLYCVKLILQ